MRPDPNHRLNSQHQGKMLLPIGMESIKLGFEQICQIDSYPETIKPVSISIPTSVLIQPRSEECTYISIIHSFNQYF